MLCINLQIGWLWWDENRDVKIKKKQQLNSQTQTRIKKNDWSLFRLADLRLKKKRNIPKPQNNDNN